MGHIVGLHVSFKSIMHVSLSCSTASSSSNMRVCSGGHFVFHWTVVAVGNHPVDEQQLRTVCVVRARTCSGLW